MIDYSKLMKQCIKLAKNGKGKTSPNPLVGCVVLDKNNNIISTGYHHKYGENHAERDALLKLKNGEEKDGTLIVNLEPCSHHGKTPPCADLIIERGLKKVVIGCVDNNPKVNGGGIQKLKNAGIEVIIGVLEEECRKLNEIFFTDIEKKRTFVVLKTASTLDGKTATQNGDSKWITSDKSRKEVKKLRKHYDAILTSSNTIVADKPEMLHKTKIILDTNLKTDFNSKIYKNGEIIIVTSKDVNDDFKTAQNIKLITCKTNDNKIDLKDLLSKLYNLGIKSIFVECGGTLAGSFIKEDLVDKVYHFIAPKILNDNSGMSCFNGDNIEKINNSKLFKIDSLKKIDEDVLITYTKK